MGGGQGVVLGGLKVSNIFVLFNFIEQMYRITELLVKCWDKYSQRFKVEYYYSVTNEEIVGDEMKK